MIKLSPEAQTAVLQRIQSEYDLQYSALKPWRDLWEVQDYMWRCGQDADTRETERAKGTNDAAVADQMANTASTMIYRQINQKAAQGVAVERSRPAPFKYEPIINEEIFGSQEEGRRQARQWNLLARWTIKNDKWGVKGPDFWTALRKFGNCPVQIHQHRVVKTVKYRVPKYRQVPQPDGSVADTLVGYEEKSGEFVTENWPSLTPRNIECIIADPFIPCLNDQDQVAVVSKCSLSSMYGYVKAQYWDAEAVAEVRKSVAKWDGSTNAEILQARLSNQGVESQSPAKSSQWLRYDVFVRLAINEKGEEDPEAEPMLYLITVIGNTISGGKIVYMSESPEDFDPDGEIPIIMVKGQPDDHDLLYHMGFTQALRSNYSVECTLKNQALDNSGLVNRPPMIEKEGAVRGTDRTFRSGQIFITDNIDASIKEFAVRDTTLQTVQLLEYIQNDSKQAASTDANMMGQGLGGRTSSAEATNVYRNSIQAPLMEVNYVCQQIWSWVAKKYLSYWKNFAEQGQIMSITDEQEEVSLQPENLYGEFDVEVNIADEFEDDVVMRQQVWDFLNLVGRNPSFLQRIDVGELLKAYKLRSRLTGNFIINPVSEDSVQIAGIENDLMISGQYIAPISGQDHDRHIAIHKGEEIRYRGLEDKFPEVKLITQHIAEHELLKKQDSMQQQGQAMGSMPSASGNDTAGMVAGNEIAGAIGAQQ